MLDLKKRKQFMKEQGQPGYDIDKQIHLKQKVEAHLRQTARHLVRFDTFDETLNYLLESFWMELTCDFVAIVLKEEDNLVPKIWKGQSADFEKSFPLSLGDCPPNLMEDALWWPNETGNSSAGCHFQKVLEEMGLSTWFTVPLKDENQRFGLCIIGFHQIIPLILDLERTFVEFGKDVAVAISLAQSKEVQRIKMNGMDWIKENVYLGSSIEQIVEKIVERAGKGTVAKTAYIFLYDEVQNCFFFQPPSYGNVNVPQKIIVDRNCLLDDYFPYLEKPGGGELTVPLVVNFKTIGILHVAEKQNGHFSKEDLELLEFLSSHVSALVETARLYRNEKEQKHLLQTFMLHHRELVKQTVEGENLHDISKALGILFSRPLIIFDRFLNPISHHLHDEDQQFLESAVKQVQEKRREVSRFIKKEFWMEVPKGMREDLGIWPVISGGELLGFLAIHIKKEELNDLLRMTIDHALNVYSIQFMKQKLVMDAKEQVKDSFISLLFAEKIGDYGKIIEYANLFNWNLFHPHRVGILSIEMTETTNGQDDLLNREAKKSWLWEQVRNQLSGYQPGIVFSRKEDQFILIFPFSEEQEAREDFLNRLYQRIKKSVMSETNQVEVYLGIGGKTGGLEDYYSSYKQAVQAHKLIHHRFRQKGFAVYEDLSEYTLLNSVDESLASLFIHKYLQPLMEYSSGKGADLFLTLRSYLDNNGNLSDTKDALFIHRSTLTYRLEKIQDILGFDIEEQRFNLMMAFKLYDLYQTDLDKEKEIVS